MEDEAVALVHTGGTVAAPIMVVVLALLPMERTETQTTVVILVQVQMEGYGMLVGVMPARVLVGVMPARVLVGVMPARVLVGRGKEALAVVVGLSQRRGSVLNMNPVQSLVLGMKVGLVIHLVKQALVQYYSTVLTTAEELKPHLSGDTAGMCSCLNRFLNL